MMSYNDVQSTYKKSRNDGLPQDIGSVSSKTPAKAVKKLVSGHVLATASNADTTPAEFRNVVGTMANVIRKAGADTVQFDFDALANGWKSALASTGMTDELAVETFGLVRFVGRRHHLTPNVVSDAVFHEPFASRMKNLPRLLSEPPDGGYKPNIGIVAGYTDFSGNSPKAKQVLALAKSVAASVPGEVFLLTPNKQPDELADELLELGITCVWVKPDLDKPQSLDAMWAAHRQACDTNKICITLFTNTHGSTLYMAQRLLSRVQVICLWFGDNLYSTNPPFDHVMMLPMIDGDSIDYTDTVIQYGDFLTSVPAGN